MIYILWILFLYFGFKKMMKLVMVFEGIVIKSLRRREGIELFSKMNLEVLMTFSSRVTVIADLILPWW